MKTMTIRGAPLFRNVVPNKIANREQPGDSTQYLYETNPEAVSHSIDEQFLKRSGYHEGECITTATAN